MLLLRHHLCSMKFLMLCPDRLNHKANHRHSLYLLLILLIIPILFVIAQPIPDVEGAVDLQEVNIKVVVDFEYPMPLAKLNADYRNQLEPEIDIIANNFGSEYNSFSYEVELDVTNMGMSGMSGNTMYQIYPKIILTGSNSTKLDSEFAMEFNTTIANIRIAIIDFLSDNGASSVSTHIHFTFGSFDFDEGF